MKIWAISKENGWTALTAKQPSVSFTKLPGIFFPVNLICFGKRESRARRPFKATLYACTQLRLAACRILLRDLGIPSRLNG